MKLERSEFDILTPGGGGGGGGETPPGPSPRGIIPWPPPESEDGDGDAKGGTEMPKDKGEKDKDDKGKGGKSKEKGEYEVKVTTLGKGGMGGTMTPEQSKALQEEMGIEIVIPTESDAKKLEEQAANSMDSLPKGAGRGKGLLRRRIAELTRPKVDWKAALKRFIGKAMSNAESILPNRRFVSRDQYISGERTKYDALGNAIVAVDTSGSMSQEDITQILSETLGIIKAKKIKKTRIVYFDDGIKGSIDEVKFPNPKIDFNKVEGGGGTTFAQPLAFMLQEFKKNKADLLVFCTDGMNADPGEVAKLSITPNFKKVLVWVIMDMPEYQPPFGSMSIHISKRDMEK
jgi:hypothetical protein